MTKSKNKQPYKIILAIETSCDETSAAIIQDGRTVLSNVISSQIKIHQKFGGVVPEFASRLHTEKINQIINQAISEANITQSDINAVAVTFGPGLEGALLIGVVAAKTIAHLLKIPLIGVNHLHGHIYANFLTDTTPQFPFMSLIVSGGHTELVLVKSHMTFQKLGRTLDDAAGESFDKIARFLDLGYPGGPIVEKKAQSGNPKAFNFPRAVRHKPYEFSFSGLKTAVIEKMTQLKKKPDPLPIPDICASFQQAVIESLLSKAIKACKTHQISTLVLAGGVSANTALRTAFQTECHAQGIVCLVPPIKYCTDNAAMIGAAAYFTDPESIIHPTQISVNPNLE